MPKIVELPEVSSIATTDVVPVYSASGTRKIKAGNLPLQTSLTSQLGAANGIATLGSDGKVPAGQMPASVGGGLSYQGIWNASTNSPSIPAASSSNKGQYYKVSVSGSTNINGITSWAVGDWIVSNGATWDKIDQSETVSSVAGKVGAVSLVPGDVGLGNVNNTSDANKPVSTSQQAALDLKANLASLREAVAFGAISSYSLGYDTSGRLSTFTMDGTTYTIAYHTDGRINTISGGGSTMTINYDSSFRMTGGTRS